MAEYPPNLSAAVWKEAFLAAEARIAKLEAALKPFADFADMKTRLSSDHVITEGSRLAKRQLTMFDCYHALDALKEQPHD